jgi:hypothetical protein
LFFPLSPPSSLKGCPLPFDPRCYPQPVLPQQQQQQQPQQQTSSTANEKPKTSTNQQATTKEEKIAKYREKRNKRNFNRPVDQQRSAIALSRPRDGKGKFEVMPTPESNLSGKVERSLRAQVDGKILSSFSFKEEETYYYYSSFYIELKLRLAVSETESRYLKDKISFMEQEVRSLKLQQQNKLKGKS